MKLLGRSTPEPDPSEIETDESDADVTSMSNASSAAKGRATPKRRDAAPKRQPISAPRTTKEANRMRKQQASQPGAKRPVDKRSTRELRAAMKRGDESALTRRDQGQVRRLTRDYVDSHFMFSNFLLLAFPLLLFASAFPYRIGTYVTIGLLILFAVEWTYVGRKVYRIATDRFGTVKDKGWVLGLYAGQRAFLPRRWRIPQPNVKRGDPI